MDAKLSKRRITRAGFTLIELLVVVAIIALLASLVIVGGSAAWRAAKRAVITTEIRQMQIALAKYKGEYGDYPPDCYSANLSTDTAAQNRIVRHFQKRFPNYRPANWAALCSDALAAGVNLENLDPSSAFAFFLGGIPNGDGKPTGFSTKQNPFESGGSRIDPLFEFDETRYEVTADGVPVYYPRYIENPGNSSGVPYVYFQPRSGAYGPRTLKKLHSSTQTDRVEIPRYPLVPDANIGVCVPYARMPVNSSSPKDNTLVDWHAPKEFQIITAGLDGQFGTTGMGDPGNPDFDPDSNPLDAYRYIHDDDNNLEPAADDNLTSFAPGQLKDVAE